MTSSVWIVHLIISMLRCFSLLGCLTGSWSKRFKVLQRIRSLWCNREMIIKLILWLLLTIIFRLNSGIINLMLPKNIDLVLMIGFHCIKSHLLKLHFLNLFLLSLLIKLFLQLILVFHDITMMKNLFSLRCLLFSYSFFFTNLEFKHFAQLWSCLCIVHFNLSDYFS